MNQSAPNSAQDIRSHIVFVFALAFGGLRRVAVRVSALLYVSALLCRLCSRRWCAARRRLRIAGGIRSRARPAIFFLLLLVAGALTALRLSRLPPVVQRLEAVQGEMPARFRPAGQAQTDSRLSIA